MDDVIADWTGWAQNYLGKTWTVGSERIPMEDWNRLKQEPRMYNLLPLKLGAGELVAYCRRLIDEKKADQLAFLTALPHDYSMPYAAQDKVWWADRYFSGIPVFFGPFSHDKWRHCQPGDILIDDRPSNCSEWQSQGGLAHLYRNWAECEKWLEETFK